MDAESLLAEILAALESHPDPAFARKAAIKVIEDSVPEDADECPYCGGEL